jgi:hypothetical protein
MMEIALVYALVPLFFLLAVLFVVIFLSHLPPTDDTPGTSVMSSGASQTGAESNQTLACILLVLLLIGFCVLTLLNERGQQKAHT